MVSLACNADGHRKGAIKLRCCRTVVCRPSVSSLKQLAPSTFTPSKGGTVVKWLLLPCNFTRLALRIDYVEGCTNTSRCSASAKKTALFSFAAENLTFKNYQKRPVYWSFSTRELHNTDQYSGHLALMG